MWMPGSFFWNIYVLGDEKAAGDVFYRKLLLTFWYDKYIVCVAVNFIKDSLFIQSGGDTKGSVKATATPENPGRCQPERVIEQ